jgi:serine phosphatase RsbU (regulator of sigma subunit)
VRQPDGSASQISGGTYPLIGVLGPLDRRREDATVTLAPGSLLLLYTDGLVETREREYDAGVDELRAALTALDPEATPDEVCEALVGALVHGDLEDDAALLVLRIDTLPTSS